MKFMWYESMWKILHQFKLLVANLKESLLMFLFCFLEGRSLLADATTELNSGI